MERDQQQTLQMERLHTDANKKVMHLSCVTFSYVGETSAVLDCCSGVVWEGTVVMISGRNGSGKSTLCRLLADLMTPQDGMMSGELLRGDDPKPLIGYIGGELAQQFVIGVVEDELAFGPENLGLARDEIGRRVERELHAVNMVRYLDKRVEHLSGGQQQRVAAAAVWTMEPEVLIIDDAWSALDADGRVRFTDAVYRWYNEGHNDPSGSRARTLIVSTARKSELDASHPLWERAEHWTLEDGRLHIPSNMEPASASAADVHNERLDAWDALMPSAAMTSDPAGSPVLEFSGVTARYRNGYIALRDASGLAMPGDGIILRGNNGAGKSSLLKVLSGALRQYKGTIHIHGQDLKRLKPHELAGLIGYVPQRAAASFMTERVIDECMDVYRELNISEIDGEAWCLEQLQAIGLRDFAHYHPHDLSVSLQRRLSLWIAAVHRPVLLLLDEPTAGLDEIAAREVIAWCNRERARGAAVIAVTHDPLWLGDAMWKQWHAENGSIQPV
ncbi:ATP-binding cassette domain-containing protein [Paenibacillus marinisediminis]